MIRWLRSVRMALLILSFGVAVGSGCRSESQIAEEQLRDARRDVRQARRALRQELDAQQRRLRSGARRPIVERTLLPDLHPSEAAEEAAEKAWREEATRDSLEARSRDRLVAPRATELALTRLKTEAPQEFSAWQARRRVSSLPVRERAVFLVAEDALRRAKPVEFEAWVSGKKAILDGRGGEEVWKATAAAAQAIRTAIPEKFEAWRKEANEPGSTRPIREEGAAEAYAEATLNLRQAAPEAWAAFEAAEHANGRDPIVGPTDHSGPLR